MRSIYCHFTDDTLQTKDTNFNGIGSLTQHSPRKPNLSGLETLHNTDHGPQFYRDWSVFVVVFSAGGLGAHV